MIAVRDIAYVRYQAPDLDAMEKFLVDFGMKVRSRTENTLYMRGYASPTHAHITERGVKSAGIGFGLLAQSRDDLDKIAAEFGVEVRDNEEPGGGDVVTIQDPFGFRVDVLHGFEPLTPLPTRTPTAMNPAVNRARHGQTVRLEQGASHVMRLGHVVLKTPDFDTTHDFYHKLFGFRISDSYHAEDPAKKEVAFMHCGLGKQYVDHHTLAIIALGSPQPGFDHSAFEVLDIDDLAMGNGYLAGRNYKHSWGIGRHIEGSQIFDYWRDPFGNKIEHWTDGDLVNDDYESGHLPMSPDALAQWAPPLNPEFFE